MTLTLSILRCPDTMPPQTRTVAGGEFAIGRGPENDWVLADPERVISKRHCVLAYRSDGWQVADLSTNGTFLNSETEPVGHGRSRELRDGDRLRLGPYEIELRISETAASRGSQSMSDGRSAFDPFAASLSPPGAFAEQDPFFQRDPGEDPFAVQLAPPSIKLPPDYDPLASEAGDALPGGATQPDHSPHGDDAYRPGAVRALLPDDWDRELTPQPVTSSARAPAPAPEPPSPATPLPRAAPSAGPISAAPANAAATGTSEDLLAAFLRGVGLPLARPADPVAAMEALGEAFRALVSGLRLGLIARSAIKAEFRISQTVIRSRGNNPLKFSADDEDALLALLGSGRRTEMGAAEAVEDALRDIRRHEIATVAAMRSAVRALISHFDPVKLRLAAERGGMNLVPMQQKGRAWDAFEALFTQTTHALNDDFDSIFGRAFGLAYEQALNDVRERESEQ